MDLGLKDRVAIVAAASEGMGKAIAQGFAREGAKVAICARNAATLEKTAAEIGPDVFSKALDVTDFQAVRDFVRQTHQHFGRIDICLANAGGPPSKPFADTTIDDWNRAAQLNLMSTVHFAKETLPLMQQRKWGRFLALTSMTVKQPVEGLVLSNSVRGAVSGLVKTLSNEYGPDNITVNSVCPGYIATARLLDLSSTLAARHNTTREAIEQQWAAQSALRRIGTPEEFADAVLFLASERAAYITGVNLLIDGGTVKGVY